MESNLDPSQNHIWTKYDYDWINASYGVIFDTNLTGPNLTGAGSGHFSQIWAPDLTRFHPSQILCCIYFVGITDKNEGCTQYTTPYHKTSSPTPSHCPKHMDSNKVGGIREYASASGSEGLPALGGVGQGTRVIP